MLLLDQPARLGRRVEKQHPPGFRAGALPGMRHAARHEGIGAGAADADLVADHESDLAAQDIGHLVAVVMQMKGALGAGGDGFLEYHDAVAGRAAEQLERELSARRRARHLALSRLYDDALHTHRHLPFRTPAPASGCQLTIILAERPS